MIDKGKYNKSWKVFILKVTFLNESCKS